MKQLLDFIPVLLFVAVYFLAGIYPATAALMVGVCVQVLVYRWLGRRIGRELQITFWVSMIFGGLTLVFRNQVFIQWKPTIVNWLLAVSLIASHYLSRENLIQKLLGSQLELPQPVWNHLNFGWAVGFGLAGVLNLVVAYNFSMEFWVSYKLIGGFALTLLYIVLTVAYLAKLGHLETLDADRSDNGLENGLDVDAKK